jgi:hypothetical protein
LIRIEENQKYLQKQIDQSKESTQKQIGSIQKQIDQFR